MDDNLFALPWKRYARALQAIPLANSPAPATSLVVRCGQDIGTPIASSAHDLTDRKDQDTDILFRCTAICDAGAQGLTPETGSGAVPNGNWGMRLLRGEWTGLGSRW